MTFDYTDQATVGTIIADTPDMAIEGAKKMIEGKVKGATNFVASEYENDVSTPVLN